MWLIVISTLSLIELDLEKVPKVDQTDKVVHFLFHFILALFLVLHLVNERMYSIDKKLFYITIFFSVTYGLSIEGLQAILTAKRHADIYDVMANTTGCIAFLLFYGYFLRLKR